MADHPRAVDDRNLPYLNVAGPWVTHRAATAWRTSRGCAVGCPWVTHRRATVFPRAMLQREGSPWVVRASPTAKLQNKYGLFLRPWLARSLDVGDPRTTHSASTAFHQTGPRTVAGLEIERG